MIKSSRNSEIELLRFMFAVAIMIFHYNASYSFNLFENGAIGVEFFFILSGILMAGSAHKETMGEKKEPIGRRTVNFLVKKARAFYPCYILAILFQFIFRWVIVEHWSLKKIAVALLESLPSLLCIQMSGFDIEIGIAGGVVWYLSAMLLAMAVLYPLLLWKYDFSSKILLPLIGLFSLGAMSKEFGTIVALTGDGLIYNGMRRAIGEICIGVAAYVIATRLRELEFTKFSHLLSAVSKLVLFGIVFLNAAGIIELRTYIVFAIMTIGMVLVYSEVGMVIPANNKVCIWLGKLSLPLYLIHSPIKGILMKIGGINAIVSMLLSVLAAVGLMYLAAFIEKNFAKIRRMFIK